MNGGLSARSLCAGYDGRALLKDVNLTLRPGEVYRQWTEYRFGII